MPYSSVGLSLSPVSKVPPAHQERLLPHDHRWLCLLGQLGVQSPSRRLEGVGDRARRFDLDNQTEFRRTQ